MSTVKPGTRLRSAVCETEVIVIRAPASDVDLRCGGAPLLSFDDERPADGRPAAGHDAGTLLGKRYALADPDVELLCTKGGAGSLSLGDEPIPSKEARPLPSSD
ncbi:MAG TPA: hypothetical protein VK277_17365 [Acidimicrobiales bacterium]|nr:hypothetical protein [Acidimicrobiales bacterium]